MKDDEKAKAVNEPQVKPLLKTNSPGKKIKKKKSVAWDTKTLAEQELDRKLHPVTMRIDEPKTPYIPYEGEDEYLSKITEVNKLQPTEELLSNVLNKLNDDKFKDKTEYLEVEVVCPDGSTKKELVKKEHVNKEEFLKKRHKAYANEFTEAKKHFNKESDPTLKDAEKILMEETINNTLYNKYAGKIKEVQKDSDSKDVV